MMTSPMTLEEIFPAELTMFIIIFSKWSMPKSDSVSPHHLPEFGFDGSERIVADIALRQAPVTPISSEISRSFLSFCKNKRENKKKSGKINVTIVYTSLTEEQQSSPSTAGEYKS